MRSATPDAIKKAIPRRVQRNKRKAALLVRPGSDHTAAPADDGTTAPEYLAKLTAEHRTRLVKVWADGKYNNHRLNDWMRRSGVRAWRSGIESSRSG